MRRLKVWSLGLGVGVWGCGVWGLGCVVDINDAVLKDFKVLGFKVRGLGFLVWSLGCRADINDDMLENFSKVRPLLNLACNLTIDLTFEKFYKEHRRRGAAHCH